MAQPQRRLPRLLLGLALLPLTSLSGCEQAECASPDYRRAECRALAAWELARVSTANGAELRFTRPGEDEVERRAERGHLVERSADTLRARSASGGGFAISAVSPNDARVRVDLENVAPRARVLAGPTGAEVELLEDAPLRRSVELDLRAGEPQWIRAELDCPTRARMAFLGDVQTNPDQFERIIEALRSEAVDAEAAGAPLLALSVAGDLSETSLASQFDRIDAALARSPVPVQITPGNHDIFKRTDAIFNLRYGPGTHVATACGVRVVHLDSGSAKLAPSVEGRLPQLLAREGEEHLVIVTHYPPYAGLTGAGWSREDQAQRLLLEAALADVDLIVAGHYHGVRDFEVPVAGQTLREIISGTGGANQGLGTPRYGYLRIEFDTSGTGPIDTCFVEVPPPGAAGVQTAPAPGLPLCAD